jgi:hypothetical protein
MHKQVENEERFPAFGRAPKDTKANARNYALDEIGRRCVERDLIEWDQLEAPPLRRRIEPVAFLLRLSAGSPNNSLSWLTIRAGNRRLKLNGHAASEARH